MPQYMLLIYEDPTASPAPNSPQAQAEFGEYGAFTEDIRTKRAVRVGRAAADDRHRHDRPRQRQRRRPRPQRRPFAETKEWLAGYYVLDCPDLDTATAQAARIPAARHGAIEVRPVMEIPGM